MTDTVKIIREVRRPRAEDGGDYQRALCVVRSNCYGSRLDYLLQLAAAAREDFPHLTDEDIEIKHYAGRHYARTFGIEFNVPVADVPDSYKEIREVEHTY